MPDEPKIFVTGPDFESELEAYLNGLHKVKPQVKLAVAYVLDQRQPNNSQHNLTWMCQLEHTRIVGALCCAFRYWRYMPDSDWSDTDGIYRFRLTIDGFVKGSRLFREPLTAKQITGPDPPAPPELTPKKGFAL